MNTASAKILSSLNLTNLAPKIATLDLSFSPQNLHNDIIVDANMDVLSVPHKQVLCPTHPLHSKTSNFNELITKHPFYKFFEEYFLYYLY